MNGVSRKVLTVDFRPFEVEAAALDLDSKEMGTSERDEWENIIFSGDETFVAVGNALIQLRDRRGYRFTHRTFKEYVERRFGWGVRRAYDLIAAVETINDLEERSKKTQTPVLQQSNQKDEQGMNEKVRIFAHSQSNQKDDRPVAGEDQLGKSKYIALARLPLHRRDEFLLKYPIETLKTMTVDQISDAVKITSEQDQPPRETVKTELSEEMFVRHIEKLLKRAISLLRRANREVGAQIDQNSFTSVPTVLVLELKKEVDRAEQYTMGHEAGTAARGTPNVSNR